MHRSVCLTAVLASLLLTSAATEEKSASDETPLQPWTTLSVPGTWDEQSGGELADYDGFAWYRCSATIPGSWKGKDLELRVEKIDNAHEAYFNGARLGGAGSFPPDYKSGLAESKRYRIDPKHVRVGKDNVVAIRVFDHDGRGGFKGAAPVIVSEKQAIALNGRWEFRTGDDTAWAGEPIALTTTGIFWRVMPAELALENAKSPGTLSPVDAVKSFTVPDDLVLEQVLAEPIVRQPLFLNFDERGRMWVVQYIQYPYPAGLKMVSKDQYWRAVYDKVPPPPPNHFRGADKITIHEDTDGDGTFDKHKTFIEGLNIASACAKGRGGVWVLNPPYLLFYPDEDDDDVPDGPPEVHLQGFGMEDTHSVVNSLRWGPDGWLYAAQGSTVSGNVSVPARSQKSEVRGQRSDDSQAKPAGRAAREPGDEQSDDDRQPSAVYSMGQLIWRYHPETRRYEIFAEGGGNAFGVEIDSKGRIYSGHNGGNTRGFHYVQGGYYQKGFTKHGPLSNPYAFGYFAAMKHGEVPRFTHNFVIYEADALPEEYHGRLFGIEPLQGRVVMADITADRSSFQTKDLGHPVTTTDRRFRPVDIKVGPDGAIYVADFYEPQISHREHFSGQIDKTTGRIYRLRARSRSAATGHRPKVGRGARSAAPFDLRKHLSRELVELLDRPNKWHRQTALRLLGDRKDRSIVPLLREKIEESTGQLALECLWALHLSGGLEGETALKLLEHDDPYVRLWAVRLLCDENQVTPAAATKLAELAGREAYVHVRSQLASSARRLPANHALPIIRNLLGHDEDADDIHLPLLLWWALEAKIGEQQTPPPTKGGPGGGPRAPDSANAPGDPVLALFKDRELWNRPIVEQHILERLMRRYAMAGSRVDLVACARLLELSPGPEQSKRLMQGFEHAFKGRTLAGLPAELVKALANAGGGSLTLRIRQGDNQAVNEALQAVADRKADVDKRIEYVEVFGEVGQPRCVPVLLKVLADLSGSDGGGSGNSTAGKSDDRGADRLCMAILTALQAYRDEPIGRTVVDLYSHFPKDVRDVAQTLLVSRKEWNRQFLEAVEAGRVAPDSIPLDVVRKMTVHRDERIAALVRKHWKGVEGASSAEMQEQIEKLQQVLRAGSGDPYKGKQLYSSSCAKCHIFFGEGGRIGPDLTTYKRDDVLQILINVVNPSAEVREGFETFLVLTEDGRTATGFLYDRDNRVVVLRGADGQNITIPRDEIDEMLPQKKSLMPEGLLKDLSEQQVRDLFAYLRSSQPLNR